MPRNSAVRGSAGYGSRRASHARIAPDVLGDPDLRGIGHLLDARRDVHGLAEVVELVIEGDRDRRPVVDADLEQHGPLGLVLVEAFDGAAHLERRADRERRVRIGGHDRIADGLHDRPAMAHGRLAQQVEMLLDQLEGVQIADPLIERGRSPDVREQERDVADREALRATDHLGTEQAPERLAGEQVLAGEVGIEAQERVLVAWSRLEDGENPAARRRVLDLEHDRSWGQHGLVRLIAGAEIGQAQPLRLGAGLGPDLQHEPGVGVRAAAEERPLRCLEREGGGTAGFQKPQPAQRLADRVEIGLAVRPAPLAHAFEHEHVVERVERLRTMVADGADLG